MAVYFLPRSYLHFHSPPSIVSSVSDFLSASHACFTRGYPLISFTFYTKKKIIKRSEFVGGDSSVFDLEDELDLLGFHTS